MESQRFLWSSIDQLPPKYAAFYLGGSAKPLCLQTLANWRRKNIGPRFIRVGKSIRYRKEDLDAFIESSKTARVY